MSEQADRPAPAAPSLPRSLVQFCESVKDQQEGVALAAAPPICRVGGLRVEPGAEAPAKLRTSACGLATGSTVCRCSCRLRGDCDRRWRLAAGYVLERFGDELCVGVYVILAYLAPTDSRVLHAVVHEAAPVRRSHARGETGCESYVPRRPGDHDVVNVEVDPKHLPQAREPAGYLRPRARL